MADFVADIERARRELSQPKPLPDRQEVAPPNVPIFPLANMREHVREELFDCLDLYREDTNLPSLDQFRFLIVEGSFIFASYDIIKMLNINVFMDLPRTSILQRRRFQRLPHLGTLLWEIR
jgi:hypothetical protein